MENYPPVTVYTCVCNGERTLHRVFESMKALDYPNIEHVIVNDGSTDGTDALIEAYIREVSFPVKYYKKENGGKHTALNTAWDLAEGMFMIQLDADDRLPPHSIRFLVDTYYSIPEEIRSQYWCVHGRCVTQYGDFVGDPSPADINDRPWPEAGKLASRCKGEKVGLQVREYLAPYRFPEVKGVTHVSEMIVWKQLNDRYGTWYTNEVVRTYYVNEGGNLTAKKRTRKQFASTAYTYKWMILHEEEYGFSPKNLIFYALLYFVTTAEYRRYNPYFEGIRRHKIPLAILYPIMFFGGMVFRLVFRIR